MTSFLTVGSGISHKVGGRVEPTESGEPHTREGRATRFFADGPRPDRIYPHPDRVRPHTRFSPPRGRRRGGRCSLSSFIVTCSIVKYYCYILLK